jgi:hypothetical protein
MEFMVAKDADILATRAEELHFASVRDLSPRLRYDPVAEKAAVTAEVFGNQVQRTFDVGVARLHRLLTRLDVIRGVRAAVAVAGMEGVLPSMIGGLTKVPGIWQA